MGGIWTDIAAARYAAGRLWHPSLSLDMLARDWAGITVPLTLRFDTQSDTPTYNVWNDWFNLYLWLPADWDGDATFADIGTHISIQLNLYTASFPTYYVRIEDGDNEVEPGDPAAWLTLTKTLNNADWASGMVTLNIQHKSGGAAPTETVTAYAMTAEDGPRAFYQVRLIV